MQEITESHTISLFHRVSTRAILSFRESPLNSSIKKQNQEKGMMKSVVVSSLAFSIWAAPAVAEIGFDSNCTTVTDIICDNDGEYPTDVLCEAMKMAGIEDEMESETWTVFAPTNDAFDDIPDEVVDILTGDPSNDETRALMEILGLHVFPGEALKSTDLECDGKILMANEEYTVTICEGNRMYQMGPGNLVTDYPEITVANIEACNGIVHLISEVLL